MLSISSVVLIELKLSLDRGDAGTNEVSRKKNPCFEPSKSGVLAGVKKRALMERFGGFSIGASVWACREGQKRNKDNMIVAIVFTLLDLFPVGIPEG